MAEGPGHRSLVGLFGRHPGIIFNLLKIPRPDGYTAECGSENLSSSRTGDNILKVKDGQGVLILAVILETQLGKGHDVRRWTWAQYYYALHVLLKKDHPECEVRLVVFTIDDKVADWAREPVVQGKHSFAPDFVIAPRGFPKITDGEEARRDPVLALLSAVMHRDDLGGWQAAVSAIATLAPVELL